VPLWRLAAGMWLYDLLALFRNVAPHRMLSKRALLAREPMIRERGLLGGARYFDAQCDDARLVLATARSAALHGARIATYTRVEDLELTDGRVTGARVVDLLGGSRGVVRAAAVVNATGPWTDRVRGLEDPHCGPVLRPTKGVHLVIPRSRLGQKEAIAFLSPIDGRVMFALPWGDDSYVGTTDTDAPDPPETVAADPDDIVYLLRSINALFPNARLGTDDVRVTWAGLRPLLADGPGGPSGVSREHAILEGPAGMLTVAGGKLTTYRVMAQDAVDRVVEQLRDRGYQVDVRRAATDQEPLLGGETAELGPFHRGALELGLNAETAEHLVTHYGTETAGIVNLAGTYRELQRRLHPEHAAIEAEVVHAARRELAQRVEDVLIRRIHLYYETADRGRAAARRTAELLGRELGWPAARVQQEAAHYTETASTPR
jgi:glycerol-3-phosphate dehydrogenase